jgi:hypothetical protein
VYAVLHAGGCGGWVLFDGGVVSAGGDVVCASLYGGGRRGERCMLEVVEVVEVSSVCGGRGG